MKKYTTLLFTCAFLLPFPSLAAMSASTGLAIGAAVSNHNRSALPSAKMMMVGECQNPDLSMVVRCDAFDSSKDSWVYTYYGCDVRGIRTPLSNFFSMYAPPNIKWSIRAVFDTYYNDWIITGCGETLETQEKK